MRLLPVVMTFFIAGAFTDVSFAADPNITAKGTVQQSGNDAKFFRTFTAKGRIYNRMEVEALALVYAGTATINCNYFSKYSQIKNMNGWHILDTSGKDTFNRPGGASNSISWGPLNEEFAQRPSNCLCYCAAITPESTYGTAWFSNYTHKRINDDAVMDCAVVSPAEEPDPNPWWLGPSY